MNFRTGPKKKRGGSTSSAGVMADGQLSNTLEVIGLYLIIKRVDLNEEAKNR